MDQQLLLRDYHLCGKCRSYLGLLPPTPPPPDDGTAVPVPVPAAANDDDDDGECCLVCMGLWQEAGTAALHTALTDACEPYGGIKHNRFAGIRGGTTTTTAQAKPDNSSNNKSSNRNGSPTVSLAGDVAARYLWCAGKVANANANANSATKGSPVPFSVYVRDLKQHLQAEVSKIVGPNDEKEGGWWNGDGDGNGHGCAQEVQEEEQGYLSLHILCVPSRDMRPTLAEKRGSMLLSSIGTKKRKRHHHHGQLPYVTQGGDPRANLEERLRHGDGYRWTSQAVVEAAAAAAGPSVIAVSEPLDCRQPMEVHVAAFRRPIFLYGHYTKSRRDVSQTPFVVMRETEQEQGNTQRKNGGGQQQQQQQEQQQQAAAAGGGGGGDGKPNGGGTEQPAAPSSDGGGMRRRAETLGVTSVEEQICGPIRDLLGVSTRNNVSPADGEGGGGNGGEGAVVYGMCKFHSSGREDMDVRMLVRAGSTTCRGRPFCVQVVDALKPVTSAAQLQEVVRTINGGESVDDDDGRDHTSNGDSCAPPASDVAWYGNNPLGVGIAPDSFRMVPARVFSGLQEDTESKVKHYGCLCWSKAILPPSHDLTPAIFPGGATAFFPLTIMQRTPVRVLHRRANSVRERQVLSASARRIDDHHFRLELSAQAGTYVKEFVSGDLGRTVPSVASLLRAKVALLELDCEGIEIPPE